jgi:hypothetical protein
MASDRDVEFLATQALIFWIKPGGMRATTSGSTPVAGRLGRRFRITNTVDYRFRQAAWDALEEMLETGS